MTTSTDPDIIKFGLRATVDARMNPGRSLARAPVERETIGEALAAAAAEYAGQHAAALTAGWSAAELKKVVLAEPEVRAGAKRTRRRRTSSEPADGTGTSSE